MNAALLLVLNYKSTKKLIVLVLATLVVIVSLPVGMVFAFTDMPLLAWTAPLSGATSSTTGVPFDEPIVAGNTYTYGYCTYWAALRRIQTGDPIPNTWGDAITWATRAIFDGYKVDHTPTVGSIFQWPEAPGGEGHVAYVEKVDPVTGAWTISEMNAVGWDVVNERTYPASHAIMYNFIHDKEATGGIKLNF